MEFTVEGKVTLDVSISVNANTEQDAEEIAFKSLVDSYNLDVYGLYHEPANDVVINLEVFNEEDYED